MSTLRFPDESRLPARYLEPRQAGSVASEYENALADAIEAAFAVGAWTVDALVARLNASGVAPPGGGAWTPECYRDVIARLGR